MNFINLISTSGERYGMNAIIDAAHGTDNAKVRQFRLDQNPFFGALRSKTIVRLRQILNHLLVKGYLHLTTDEYPVLKVTEQGMELLQETELSGPIRMKLPKEQEKVLSKKKNVKEKQHGREIS